MGAVVTLGAAVLGFGGEFLSLQTQSESARQAQIEAERERDLAEERAREAEYERQALLERERIAAEQRTRDRLCEGHYASLTALESEFATLMSNYGSLMNDLKRCSQQSGAEGCAAAVCLIHYVGNGGDCIAVLRDADDLVGNIERERGAAEMTGCPLPSSAAMTYAEVY